MTPLPHTYAVALESNMLLAESRAPVLTGPPSQFGGTDDVWSPEQLLIAAALTCLKTTFDAIALRQQIAVLEWRGTGKGVLVKGHEGPVFASIDLDVQIVTETGSEARAQAVLASAERHCIISRALAVPVHVTSNVTSGRTLASA